MSRGKRDKIFYTNKFGFTLCQQNGQRTYGGPPPNWGSRPPPSRDCEVFIGRLPRMCFEDELIPLFLTAGELYEFRLMLDFSGTNRGYGYAHYATLAGAQRAIEKLNKYEIRPGHQIGVLKSKNNCRLLFGNIGSALDVDVFNEFIRTATEQVMNVFMFKNFQQLKQTDFRISSEVEEAFLGRVPRNNGSNQFAIVEYENHKAAAVARRVLIPKYGHILAIDWAVPPREKKRFGTGANSQVPAIERPLPNPAAKDFSVLSVSKSSSKVRPVPVLLVQPSRLDNVPFMSKTFKTVVKFFKYQLSVCLYKSVDQLEIPLFICKEIERKIVDRITNLENCSQAVQLIFNYFSWYNEKKRFIINSEVQKLLQEIKTYADCFVFYLTKRLKQVQPENISEDHYYLQILPLQLSILFRIILRSDGQYQAQLSPGITRGLKWLREVLQKGGKASWDVVEDIITLIKNDEGSSLDKASTLAKSIFLNTLTTQSQNLVNEMVMDLPLRKDFACKNPENATDPKMNMENFNRTDETQTLMSLNAVPLQKVSTDLNFQQLKGDTGHYIPMPFSQIEKIKEEAKPEPNSLPPVQLLLIQPSIMNKVPFMPDIFNNVLMYFKQLIRVCLHVNAWEMNIPRQISSEIERKIIDRISNMENCSEGVQLILTYFSSWLEKRPCSVNIEAYKLLQEIKIYADSFVNFVWSKTMSIYVPNEAVEDYFCKVLPLRLNLLFQMMLIFNCENPMRIFVGITKGLNWLEELIQNGGKTAGQFLEDLTRFIVELDGAAYERAKSLGKVFCADLMNCTGRPIVHHGLPSVSAIEDARNSDNNSLNSLNLGFSGDIPSGLPFTSSDNASDGASDYDL